MEKETVKHVIVLLRSVVDEESKLLNQPFFNDEEVVKTFDGVHKAAYELFKILYPEEFKVIDEEMEEKVFEKLTDYLYNRNQTTQNEYVGFDNLCTWLETKIRKE